MTKQLAIDYFKAFSAKDVASIAAVFAPNITLIDWNVHAIGKDAVVDANVNIFEAVSVIEVDVINLFVDGNTVIAELNIKVDDEDPLSVVDILTFDSFHKICALRAYKR